MSLISNLVKYYLSLFLIYAKNWEEPVLIALKHIIAHQDDCPKPRHVMFYMPSMTSIVLLMPFMS